MLIMFSSLVSVNSRACKEIGRFPGRWINIAERIFSGIFGQEFKVQKSSPFRESSLFIHRKGFVVNILTIRLYKNVSNKARTIPSLSLRSFTGTAILIYCIADNTGAREINSSRWIRILWKYKPGILLSIGSCTPMDHYTYHGTWLNKTIK